MSGEEIFQFLLESQYSRLSDEFPDKTLYPKFYEAKKHEIILEKGEMLHIPAGWFHWVFSEKTDEPLNISVNYWYKTNWDFGYLCSRNFFKFKYDKEIDYMKLLNDIKTPLLGAKSPQRYFPEQHIRHHFPHISCMEKFITFDEFYKSSEDDVYISSYCDPRLVQYSPSWCNTANLIQGGGRWWINKGNVTTGLHYDTNDNWIHQLSGRKRILLFHPSDYDKLYMINHYNQHFIKEVKDLFDKKKKESK